jgi:YD repeat-containing protein
MSAETRLAYNAFGAVIAILVTTVVYFIAR